MFDARVKKRGRREIGMYVKGEVGTWVVFVGVYGNMSPAVGVMRFVGWMLYGLRWEKLESQARREKLLANIPER